MPRRGGYKPAIFPTAGAPWLLDLFCGAGGASVGYHRAGFNVVGVDIEPQPHYPFTFVQADAIDVLDEMLLRGNFTRQPSGIAFAAVHASPPCQAHSDLQKQSKIEYDDYIARTRERLQSLTVPWVIENVEGAPLIDPVMLCGTAFPELRVIRHRLFESNIALTGTKCPTKHPLVFTFDKRKPHHKTLDQDTAYIQVTGGGNATVANKRAAMGTDWMTGKECNEAIPPAYAEFVGRQLMKEVH
jgi:DNA (cytosine-5)-methyltransferase 1